MSDSLYVFDRIRHIAPDIWVRVSNKHIIVVAREQHHQLIHDELPDAHITNTIPPGKVLSNDEMQPLARAIYNWAQTLNGTVQCEFNQEGIISEFNIFVPKTTYQQAKREKSLWPGIHLSIWIA